MDNTYYTFYCIEDFDLYFPFRKGGKYVFKCLYDVDAYLYINNNDQIAISNISMSKYFIGVNEHRNIIINDIL